MHDQWIYLEINPVPWAVGTLGVGKRSGKFFPTMAPNHEVRDYKEAIQTELKNQGVEMLPEGYYDLEFYFFRRLEEWRTESGRKSHSHIADATNMQKATEDALQGILIGNDANVRRIQSDVMDQAEDIKGCLVIRARPWAGWESTSAFPDDIFKKIMEQAKAVKSDNTWPPS